MKLPDFMVDEMFVQLRQIMGASREGIFSAQESPNKLTAAELERLQGGGVDVQTLDNLRVLDDGTLAYKDSRVLVYIRDIASYRGGSRGQGDLPKYHVANCDTLQDMRERNRIQRYVLSSRTDGLFLVNRLDGSRSTGSHERLKICQNCLQALQYVGFRKEWGREKRLAFVEKFRLDQFFTRYPRSLINSRPSMTAENAPLNIYAANHDEVAQREKGRRNFKCDMCHEDCSALNKRKFLHLHHRDGQKHNNDQRNLSVLCIRCHASEYRHEHLKNSKDYSDYVNRRY